MKKLFIIVFIFFSFNAISQNEFYEFCKNQSKKSFLKKEIWKNNNDFLLDYIKIYKDLDSGHIYYRVPIVLHIYLNPKEKKERLLIDIKRIIQRLNKIYAKNKTGIQFYLAQTIFLENYKHLKSNYVLEIPVISSKDQYQHAINVYYVNIIEKNIFGKKTYYHGIYNSFSHSIIAIRHSSQTTLAHEVGHFFGLEHPHKNWNKSKQKQECVSRTRKKGIFRKQTICEVNGDGLSDTPAEPELAKYTDHDCNFSGTITDNWGETYKPNTNNIMSYPGNRQCRTNFTTMQKAVMLYKATTSRYSDLWCTSNENKHLIFDKYEPDDNFETASKISINETQHHTFHKSISSNKNIFVQNNFDYLLFNSKASKIYTIEIKKGNYDFPKLRIEIYDSNKKLIEKYEWNKPNKHQVSLNKEKYYIKIENIGTQGNGQLSDYQIIIK